MTICNKDGLDRFGTIKNKRCVLSPLGKIVENQWQQTPNRFSNIALDTYVVMPSHFHGIIILPNINVGAGASPAPTLGQVVGAFKSLCTRKWRQYMARNQISDLGKFWQGNYYEHIIRNDGSLFKIRTYIRNNPRDWKIDIENLDHNRSTGKLRRRQTQSYYKEIIGY